MSDLGALDHPGTPTSPGAWDARSEEWLVGETGSRQQAEVSPGEQTSRGSEEPQAAARTTGRSEEPPAASAAARTTGRRPASARRTGADPVKTLMHRHRELCERAVDPLEIAAGLEAHGITDRTAARFRHRDVFSLAEEMYARVPRDGDTPPSPAGLTAPRARADRFLPALLPGALCAAAVTGLHLTHGRLRLVVAVAGALAVALALRVALARGPLGRTDRTRPTALATCWLVAYALLGDEVLRAAVTAGPDALPTGNLDGSRLLATTPVLALTLTCAPAAWIAHFFAVRARRQLAGSRGLEEFATSVRPLLLGTVALFLCALTALLTATAATLHEPAAYAQTLALGALLFLTRLLSAHGFVRAPSMVLATTALAEVTALATVFAAGLPGCDFLDAPVRALVHIWDPGSVPAIAGGAGALTLLIHAIRTLTRASAHAPADGRPC